MEIIELSVSFWLPSIKWTKNKIVFNPKFDLNCETDILQKYDQSKTEAATVYTLFYKQHFYKQR